MDDALLYFIRIALPLPQLVSQHENLVEFLSKAPKKVGSP